jgi:hypothetical protein
MSCSFSLAGIFSATAAGGRNRLLPLGGWMHIWASSHFGKSRRGTHIHSAWLALASGNNPSRPSQHRALDYQRSARCRLRSTEYSAGLWKPTRRSAGIPETASVLEPASTLSSCTLPRTQTASRSARQQATSAGPRGDDSRYFYQLPKLRLIRSGERGDPGDRAAVKQTCPPSQTLRSCSWRSSSRPQDQAKRLLRA